MKGQVGSHFHVKLPLNGVSCPVINYTLYVCVCVEAAQFAPLFAWKTRQLMDEGHGWKTKRGFWDEPYTTCKWRSPHMQVWATALREGRKQSYTPGRLLWSQPLQVHQAAS